MQVTCDINKCPGKYICIDQSSNRGIYKVNIKKDIQCLFTTMNIEVLGTFQWEYHLRCCNHCTSVLFSLLGLITPDTSLTNHPKWNKWNMLMVRMFSSAHALYCEQYNMWKVEKQSKSEDLALVNQRWTRMRFDTVQYHANIPKVWVWRCRTTILSPTHNPMQIWNYFIQETLWCLCKSHNTWIMPIKS